MKYYLSIMKNETPGKWMELESISVVREPRLRKIIIYFFSFLDVSFESSDLLVSFTVPTEVRRLLKGHGGPFR